MPELRLEAQDFASLAQWRWVLTDARDTVLAEREVRLDEECWQYEAFRDLGGYLTRFGRGEDTRIVAELGAWIGAEVFGPVAAAMVSRRPATVRVVVPDLATPLLYRPMEIGCFRGRPFALHDVVLVMDIESHNDDVRPVADRLRVLGLFSLPDGLRALNLRRERYSLVRLFRGIAAKGKAADIRVLQYGVSRDRLRDVLEEAEGWDIIHIAGHGAPGELLLETAEGKPDRITASHLADLLDLARERVKLVTVSGCSSAALVVHEQRRALGLPVTDDQVDDQDPGNDGSASGAIATELAERLGCAVLAMRYPVADDYVIALAAKLYDLLARQGQPLPRATGMTMRQLAAGSVSTGLGDATFPALSLAAPVLFGSRAVGLHLRAPDRRPEGRGNRMGELKMARFPPEPARFVGRTGVMARASALLSAESGIPGVLLHGMPGAGKTSCALELAYGHEHDFDPLIWYEAPDDVTGINGALSDFARTLDRHLGDFQMAHLVDDEEELAGFLPRLTEMMERFRLLIVIDNIGSLLNDGGQWRDERWGQVIGALCRDVGLGRVVLASRRLPADVTPLQALPVQMLSPDEALLLVRDLPHLLAMGRGQVPGIDELSSRRLARRAIEVAHGHPKLLELADGQAAHPDRLAEDMAADDQAWWTQDSLPTGFFCIGAAGQQTDYLDVLASWSTTATMTLALREQQLFWFLCCLEEQYRDRHFLDASWSDFWQSLGYDDHALGPERALASITAQGLVAIREGDRSQESYDIHPVVAAAGRAQAGEQFQELVDAVLRNDGDTGTAYVSRPAR